ncbi:SAM-dependent methyltransferase [Streptomyces niveiscabiei]|uniref:SAM-dependent methyltransferase n=1 Tax=Streptomyces niveiscabiei TaxID=164115 RepID=A0ABW9HGE3_9ACTN
MTTRPALDLFTGYTVTAVLSSFETSGILDLLRDGATEDDLPDCPPQALRLRTACLDYLHQRGLVEHDGPRTALTPFGHRIARDKDYLTWLHGGYGVPLAALPSLLDGTRHYGAAPRDGRVVARTSARIGAQSLLPAALDLLVPVSYDRVVDLGCGNARLLAKVCEAGRAHGVGVDISPEACDEARHELAARGLAEQVEIVCQDAFAVDDVPGINDTGLVMTFALLHEILGRGRPALTGFLNRLSALLPVGAHLLVMEVAPAGPEPGEHGVNPEFTLIHALMGQTLLTAGQWTDALSESGFETTTVFYPPLHGSVLLLARNQGRSGR